MYHWEPSDRKDRRIQRRKLREMWRSIEDEKTRINQIWWCGRPKYGVDNTLTERELDANGREFMRAALPAVGLFILMGVIMCLTV